MYKHKFNAKKQQFTLKALSTMLCTTCNNVCVAIIEAALLMLMRLYVCMYYVPVFVALMHLCLHANAAALCVYTAIKHVSSGIQSSQRKIISLANCSNCYYAQLWHMRR
jgi:hypothetical protein